MKLLVFIYAVLQMCSFITSDTNTNSTSETTTLLNSTNLARPGCDSRCGDLIVPFPFGIGTNCSLNDGFSIYCNTSVNPPKATYYEGYSSIKHISDSTVRQSNMLDSRCYYPDGTLSSSSSFMFDYTDTPLTLSRLNRFTVIGCDDSAWLDSRTPYRSVSTGCMSYCSNREEVVRVECSGNGCCQSSIPQGVRFYKTRIEAFVMRENNDFNPCAYAFVGDPNEFTFNGASDLNDTSFENRTEATVSRVFDWAIGNLSCGEAEKTDDFACQANSSCVNSTGISGGYRCICNQGYEGNPYLTPGCQDINECEDLRRYPCHGDCVNTPGSYSCTCPRGYTGDATKENGCEHVVRDSKISLPIIIGASVTIGVISLVAIIVLYKVIMKTQEKRQRNRFFKRNGGLLLKQQQEADLTLVDKTILFTSRELEKATDYFNENRILGRGGHGTVYKGMLVDGRIVAVKKSKIVDESQLAQFINEVVILSQINHRNIVKLLGCCLETDVPMLVSEFIPNGTLYDLLHNENEEFPVSLNMRLQIATEVAGSLAYLHSATSIPIYHRDIKTSNILLDDKYRAKVSDFGTSRFVALDQTHLTTIVKGTFGYLDPEYFQTSQFTDKSDVYSFGVVLVELLTREKSISLTRFGNNRSLATHFTLAMEEGRVMSIFDALVVREGNRDNLLALANLAIRCLNLSGKYRPTMKEVATELETIRASHNPSVVESNTRPIMYEEELMLFPYGESTSELVTFNNSTSQ